jgi:hypothetical protein
MTKGLMTISFVALLSSCMGPAAPAHSQEIQCNPRERVIPLIEENLGEVPINIGIGAELNKHIGGNSLITFFIELLVNKETHSFSILKSFPNGVSCLLAEGYNWDVSPFLTPSYTPIKPDIGGES